MCEKFTFDFGSAFALFAHYTCIIRVEKIVHKHRMLTWDIANSWDKMTEGVVESMQIRISLYSGL